MSEPEESFELPEELKPQRFPWRAVVVVLVLFALAVAWIMNEKSRNKSREAVVAVLEKELDQDRTALDNQKEKVANLSQQLDTMKAMIQAGQLKGGPKVVNDYNQLAAEQRAEREKWIAMASQYNEKVSRLHKLQ